MKESTTQFVTRVAKIPPVSTGYFAEQDDRCAKCAGQIRKGEVVQPLKDLPDTFTNQPQLSTGAFTCDACARMADSQFWTKDRAIAMVTEEGLFPFQKNIDIAYWVANPPKEPYAMVIKTVRIQHIYWTAEMSQPGDCGILALGNQNYLIRYPLVWAAWEASRAFFNRLENQRTCAKTKTEKNALPNPHYLIVGALDRSRTHASAISFHANDQERQQLLSLNAGEIYLLSKIQREHLEDLKRPEPLSLIPKSQKENS